MQAAAKRLNRSEAISSERMAKAGDLQKGGLKTHCRVCTQMTCKIRRFLVKWFHTAYSFIAGRFVPEGVGKN